MNDDDGFRRHGPGTHEGPPRASPYPLSRLAPPHDLVDVAREIQQADAMLGAVAAGKLRVIADQIRALQAEARAVLERAREHHDLHRAECAFAKRPGAVYHLYRRDAGALYFSMLSPDDWAGRPPHAFAGSFRLELDMSWTKVSPSDGDAAAAPDDAERAVHALLSDGERTP